MDVNIGTIEENAVFPPVGARHLYETLKTVYSVCSKNTKPECLLSFQPIMIYKLKLLFNFIFTWCLLWQSVLGQEAKASYGTYLPVVSPLQKFVLDIRI